MIYVTHELSFDQFHTKKDRIYRVNYHFSLNETTEPSVPVFVGPYLAQNFTEVETAIRFYQEFYPRTIRYSDKMFDEVRFCYADSAFFDVFDFESIAGNVSLALAQPNQLVITKSMAKKYFGDENPIGQIMNYNNKLDLEVAAVIKDIPVNSHFGFDFLTSMYTNKTIKMEEEKINFNNPNFTTFILLSQGSSSAQLEEKIDKWLQQDKSLGENSVRLPLEQLKDVHFNSTIGNYGNLLAVTDYKYLKIFIAIASLILFIAVVNYINLATARAVTRAKEVGMRKTTGASLYQLIVQFLLESAILLFPSILLSVIATNLLLPGLSFLIGTPLQVEMWSVNFLGIMLASWLLLSVLAGFYPALVLSNFKPIRILKGKFIQSESGSVLRKGLVIFQFCISTILIGGTLIILSQLKFMQDKKLGFDKEHIITISGNADIYYQFENFAERIRGLSLVQDAARTWRSPFESAVGNGFFMNPKPSQDDELMLVAGIAGDDHYIQTMGLKLISGANFNPSNIKGDSTINEIIVNEAFLKHVGLTSNDAIGKTVLNVITGHWGPSTIVGVVADFHIRSLHKNVPPVVLFNRPEYFGAVAVRMAPGNIQESLSKIEAVWKELAPQRPFNFTFLDDQYDAMYRTEQRVGTLIVLFSIVAIFVASLGLFGLSSFTTLQRAKEIGIRKVLGASSQSVIILLSRSYIKLVMVSICIAIPVCHYMLNQWLGNFEYKIDISIWHYAAAIFSIVVITLVTVGYQSYATSTTNPAETLKTE